MEKILEKIYYDPKNSGSFSGVHNLYSQAIKVNPSITIKDVKQYLSKQLPYTLHFPKRDKFKRNRIIVSKINEQWEADLVDMQMFSNKNKGIKYLLTVIDCFSKKAFVQPVKDKSAVNITKAFKIILKDQQPINLRTDRGLEFLNKTLKKLMKEKNINHFTSNDDRIKCAIVERFNRTLKSRMFKFFTARGTRRYIDNLNDFVLAYNNAYHRSIKMSPNNVDKENEEEVFHNLFGGKTFVDLVNSKINNKSHKAGDKVRIPYEYNKSLEKGYYPTFKDNIYTIEKSIRGDNRYVYKIKDSEGVLKQIFTLNNFRKLLKIFIELKRF